MPPDEKEGYINPGAPLTLGGPAKLEAPKTEEPASFLNPMPGVPIMAAPPRGAFGSRIGVYPPIETVGEGPPDAPHKPLFGDRARRGAVPQWSGVDIQRLYINAKRGDKPQQLMDAFPGRSMKSIQSQIERLFGGKRKLRGSPPGGKNYPTLKDDEFSQMDPEVRSWAQGRTQIAGDVVGFPKTLQEQDANRLKGKEPSTQGGTIVPVPGFGFDPLGDMTGGGKVLPGPGYTVSVDHDDDAA